MASIDNQGGAQNAPATAVVKQQAAQLDATGAFVATVRAEENRHSETISEMINEHFEKFGSGFVNFANGLLDRASTAMPENSFFGACISLFKGYNEAKIAGQKADIERMNTQDQIKLVEEQRKLVEAENTRLRLQKEQTEAEAEKAEAEARVSERFDSLKNHIKSFDDRFKNLENKFDTTTAGPTVGSAMPERKLSKNA